MDFSSSVEFNNEMNIIWLDQSWISRLKYSPHHKACYVVQVVIYRVIFLTGTPLKVLSVRLHSKPHKKSSKCQNFITEKNL